MKKIIALLLVLVLVTVAFAGCGERGGGGSGGATTADGDDIFNIRIGHVLAPTHPYQLGLEYFAEVAYEMSGGRLVIDAFHSSQLGNERDMVEGLQLGTLEMTLVSTAPLAGFTSDFLVFDLPFIFENTQIARATVDSEIGQDMLDGLLENGIVGLLFFENGFRSVTNSSHPIVLPSDLQGLRIRTMENPIHMDTFREMGADPTPMAFGELFTALQQGTINGQENPMAIIDTSAFYEVQTYLSLTEHFYAPAPVLIAEAFYNSLPADLRQILRDALGQAQTFQRGLLDEMNARLLEELAERGMVINEVDKAPFIAAVQAVYDRFTGSGPDQIPAELIERVQNFAG